ncbi:hypothetical protein [Bryobacter aggregatus]|uniref:hypothetical protein n=1 Tax=Bryobacter aggregatus TaxID=360054 RepID=UPI0004E27679|nr:hypothetical protein [Bryobacter aggregatus]
MTGKLLFLSILLVSCSSVPKTTAEKAPTLPDLPRAIAEDVRFPSAKRISVTVVEKPLLGLSYLGGGNLAAYEDGKKQYKLFLIRCRTAQQAGSYIFDIKNQMQDPKFVASYGGYFANTAAGPLFVFAKGSYLAGIAGLSEEEAIETGKEFAARIPN